ncbi:hypothetical protein [Nonomuraea africana]|uniref:DUF11 domain-containing protein n=1 Tax=Nonomuraea africana TaxID=46171 RepID=A0ABR9KSZ5_9ACTN|nr:hypothetical protein [Nonomuraea africana]MBE1564851.1 hypothetical protein [Nonomuraea africana]
MRRQFGMFLGLGLIAPLAPLAAAAPAVAAVAPATSSPVVAVAKKDPFSKFTVSVKYTKATKRGGKITYYIKAKNRGPYDADYFGIGGFVPKGVVPTLKWGGPKGTKCVWQGQVFLCMPRYQVPVGGTTWLNFQLTLKKNTKGLAKAKLGVVAYDLPTGAENLDQEELARLGLKGHLFMKNTTTKIVWPQKRRTGSTYTPPPPPPQPKWNPPSNTYVERNEKKDT